jgi:hypothetical protein
MEKNGTCFDLYRDQLFLDFFLLQLSTVKMKCLIHCLRLFLLTLLLFYAGINSACIVPVQQGTGCQAVLHTGFVKTRVLTTWKIVPDPCLTFEKESSGYVFRIFHPTSWRKNFASRKFRFYKKSILNKRLVLPQSAYMAQVSDIATARTKRSVLLLPPRPRYLLAIRAAINAQYTLFNTIMNH